ncbi:MAG: hypothetical protein O3B27_08535 [Actinomycetota bacterium]|nr:hypothetical protein [Actinomycetota bacterium]MDA2949899.1 hypothetical protein [Actinomycetota bacterium]MDA2991589.1 hypothetical protein [Actinomycetota bacterium]
MFFEELGDFVENLPEGDLRPRSFGGPARLDINELAGPIAAMEVGLVLVDADDPDIAVTVAFADVLQVGLGGEESIAEHLDRMHLADDSHADLPMLPGMWRDIFDFNELATGPTGLPIAEVFDVAPETIASVLIVRDIFVDEAFRGRRLGMLLASSIIGRAYMEDPTPPTLVLSVPRFGRRAVERGDTQLLPAARGYWASGLGLSDLGDGIYGLVTSSPDIVTANNAMSKGLHDLDSGYVKVDVAILRDRLSVGDPSLWPRSQGLLPRLCPGLHGPGDLVDDDLVEQFEGSLDRMARVIGSIAEGDIPDATAEVATIVRFYAEDQASAFYNAAEYLETHPDFEVRSVAVYFDDDNLAECLALTVVAVPE